MFLISMNCDNWKLSIKKASVEQKQTRQNLAYFIPSENKVKRIFVHKLSFHYQKKTKKILWNLN